MNLRRLLIGPDDDKRTEPEPVPDSTFARQQMEDRLEARRRKAQRVPIYRTMR